jgi:outer membrane protein OmpA-like peptidoglycan-associated protein
VNVISYGKERPVVFGTDTESFAQNRRGVTVVN